MDALAMIRRMGGEHFIDELYDALIRVSEEVKKTGNKGTVSVNFGVELSPGSDQMVTVNEEIAIKLPKSKAHGAYFFAHEGEFHDSDPRQTKMDFRLVDNDTGEVRDVTVAKPDVKEVN